MIEIEGVDMWDVDADAYVITTNGAITLRREAVMGRGCAAQARERFPGIAERLGRLLHASGNHVYDLGEWEYREKMFRVVSFPVKRIWRERAELGLIERSALELRKLANVNEWELVIVPRPGCGNGRLKWDTVRPVVKKVFDDRFLVVTF